MALNFTSWIINDLSQNYGSEFISKSHDISSIIPAISNCINNQFNNTTWLENEIRERHSYLSFQQPDKIAEAIKLISDKRLWQEVASIMGRTDQNIKQELSLIVDRRNKIAHEADIDPSYNLGNRWNINETLVNNAVDFLEKLVAAIHQVLN